MKQLIMQELDNKNMNRCEYGHILWHLNGRKSVQDMLDNGFESVIDESGQQVIKAVNCE